MASRSRCRPRRVCLFGTSADPPTGTAGHVGIVQTLAALPDHAFDEIRVLPVYRHTFASKRSRLSSFEDRMAMCRLAFQPDSGSSSSSSSAQTPVVVSDDEYQSWRRKVQDITDEEERAKVSVGTAALLEYLYDTDAGAKNHTNNRNSETSTGARDDGEANAVTDTAVEYTFCLGADAFLDLTAGKWKESARVLELLQGRFLVLHRATTMEDPMNGSSNDNSQSAAATANDGDREKETELQSRVQNIPAAKLVSIPSLGAVSSSQVREAIMAATDEPKQDDDNSSSSYSWTTLEKTMTPTWIHPNVLDYIRRHGLYQR